MIKVTVIAPAGLKETYLRQAAEEYEKRLRAYCDLQFIEIKPARLPEKPSQKEIAAALQKEAEEILRKIPANSKTVALCIEGETLSSVELAKEMGRCADAGKPVTFLIGSSYGLEETLKQRCDKRISFSAMTFPHQLFRIMLLEQIYRAFRINAGAAYHK